MNHFSSGFFGYKMAPRNRDQWASYRFVLFYHFSMSDSVALSTVTTLHNHLHHPFPKLSHLQLTLRPH